MSDPRYFNAHIQSKMAAGKSPRKIFPAFILGGHPHSGQFHLFRISINEIKNNMCLDPSVSLIFWVISPWKEGQIHTPYHTAPTPSVNTD